MFQFDGLRQRMSKPTIQISTNTKTTNGQQHPSSASLPSSSSNSSATVGNSSSIKSVKTKRNGTVINTSSSLPSSTVMEHGSSSLNPSLSGNTNNKKMMYPSASPSPHHSYLSSNPYYNSSSTNSLSSSVPTLPSPTDSTVSTTFTVDPSNNPPIMKNTSSSPTPVIPVIQYQALLSPTAVPSPVSDEPWWGFFISYANMRLTIATLVFWGSIIIFHQYLTKFTLYRGTVVHDMRNTPPLFDLFHEIFPNLQPYRIIPEILHVIPVLYLSGLMIYYFDQRSLDCIRTYLWIHGCIMFMRACSFTSTLLPDASQTCHKSVYTGSCHDLIFSGHVVIMILSVLMMQHFFWVPGFVRLVMGIDAAISSLLIIITHNHYTVDVLLAVFIVPFVFLAFTRHPVLASFGCLIPEKLLAKSSRLSIRNRNGFCSCRRSPNVKYGIDGYELLVEEDVQKLTDHAHATLKLFGLRPKVIIYRAGEKIPIFSDEPTTDDRTMHPSHPSTYEGVDLPSISQQMDTALENISKLQVQAFNEAQVIANAKAKAQALQNRTNSINNSNNIVSIHQLISRPIQIRNRHYDIDNPYQQQLSNNGIHHPQYSSNNNNNTSNNTSQQSPQPQRGSVNIPMNNSSTTNSTNTNRTLRSFPNPVPTYTMDTMDDTEIDSHANDSPNEEYFDNETNHYASPTGPVYHHPSPSTHSIPIQHPHTAYYGSNGPPLPAINNPPVILLQHVHPRPTTVPVLLKYTNNPNNGYYDSSLPLSSSHIANPNGNNRVLHSNIMDNYHHNHPRDEEDSLIDDTSVNDPQESATSTNSVNGNSVYETTKSGKKGNKKGSNHGLKGNTNNSSNNNSSSNRPSNHRLLPTTGETNSSPSPNDPNGSNSSSLSNSSSNHALSPPRISEVDTNQETETDTTDSSSAAETPSRPLANTTNVSSSIRPTAASATTVASSIYPVEILQTYYCNECAAYHPVNVEPHSPIPTANNHFVWRSTVGGSIPSATLSPVNNGNNLINNSSSTNRRHRSQTFDSGAVRNSQFYPYTTNTALGSSYVPFHNSSPSGTFVYSHPPNNNTTNNNNSSRNSSTSSRNRNTTSTLNNNGIITPLNTPGTPHRTGTNLSNPASPHTSSANNRVNNRK